MHGSANNTSGKPCGKRDPMNAIETKQLTPQTQSGRRNMRLPLSDERGKMWPDIPRRKLLILRGGYGKL